MKIGRARSGRQVLFELGKKHLSNCSLIMLTLPVSDGTIHLDTPFSRHLGKPPIMVAGMTPSTVKAGFVSAVLDAGFHIELAGGGHYNATACRAKLGKSRRKFLPASVSPVIPYILTLVSSVSNSPYA
jgi:hypothetical protein